jgi:hypothetical protein
MSSTMGAIRNLFSSPPKLKTKKKQKPINSKLSHPLPATQARHQEEEKAEENKAPNAGSLYSNKQNTSLLNRKQEREKQQKELLQCVMIYHIY